MKCTPTKDNTKNTITKVKKKSKPKEKNFKKPTSKEIKAYLKEKNNNEISAEHFFDYYESKGWMIGKNKMKCWKSAIRNWIRNQIKYEKKHDHKETPFERHERIVKEQNADILMAFDDDQVPSIMGDAEWTDGL